MNLLLVDDDMLVLSSLETILTAHGFDIVGQATDGESAVTSYKKLLPDVVLMDIRMQPTDGIYATEKILKINSEAKILLLTTFNEEEYIDQAMELGASGYILKQNFEELPSAIRAVHKGNIVFDKEVLSKKFKTATPKPDIDLTEREKDILHSVAEGLNNKEIAEKHYLSEGTVRNYISILLNKLNLRDRTQLAIFFYKHYQ